MRYVTLCFVDVESDGLSAGHRPWEVAVIVRRPGEPDRELSWQIRPDMAVADPDALKVGRFEERFAVLEGWDAFSVRTEGGVGTYRAISARAAAEEIRETLSGAFLVAAVPAFDAAMLAALLGDHGLAPSWHYRLIDVEALVQGYLRLPVPVGLRGSADAMRITYDPDELHTGLSDCRLARSIFDAVMEHGPSHLMVERPKDRAVGALHDALDAISRNEFGAARRLMHEAHRGLAIAQDREATL